jgi:hypothetical protein
VSKGISRALLWGALLAVAIAGCGGGDEATSLTRAEYIKRANALCETKREERNDAIAAAIKGRDQRKLLPLEKREQLVLAILPSYAEVGQMLDALGPPEGDEKEVEAIVKAIEDAVRDVKADPQAALESTRQFYKANKLTTEYGLTGCVI